MSGRLAGKVAAITGGTSGIGESAAERFVEEGAKVVIAGRSQQRGTALAERVGDAAAFIATDVTDEAQVKAMIDFAVDRFGALDVMFNNAGEATSLGGIEDVDGAKMAHDLTVLVAGVVYGMKHAVKVMRAQKSGSIINTGSIAGSRAGYGPLIYSGAKAAVAQLTRSVAMEVASDGIRVNTLSPGGTVTPIFGRVMGMSDADAAKTLDALQTALRTPLGGPAQPVDLANVAVFLASDEARMITAKDIVVDGGRDAGRTAEEQAETGARVQAALGLGG